MTLLLGAIMRNMDIWNPLIGEILKCKREPTNEADKHAVAIMRSIRQEISRWTHSTIYFKVFLYVPHDPVHFN